MRRTPSPVTLTVNGRTPSPAIITVVESGPTTWGASRTFMSQRWSGRSVRRQSVRTGTVGRFEATNTIVKGLRVSFVTWSTRAGPTVPTVTRPRFNEAGDTDSLASATGEPPPP
jgi:hypothetical protein